MTKIMLLDCDDKIKKVLSRKKFEVVSGSLGYGDGVRRLSENFYEQDLIFVNTSDFGFITNRNFTESVKTEKIFFDGIVDEFSGTSLYDIDDFLNLNGMLVVFLNGSNLESSKESAAYGWIPKFPLILPTRDKEIVNRIDSDDDEESVFISLFRDHKLAKPVDRIQDYFRDYVYPKRLLVNYKKEILASFYHFDYKKGTVLILPKFMSNNEVIEYISTVIYPMLYKITPQLPDYIKEITTQKCSDLRKEIENNKKIILEQEKLFEKNLGLLSQEVNKIEKIINSDETSKLIRKYLNDTIEDSKNAWYHAYKIKDRLRKHFGSDNNAKSILKCNSPYIYIGKICNDGNRDTRHPPEMGQVVTPLTTEEKGKLLQCSKEIVILYLKYLVSIKNI